MPQATDEALWPRLSPPPLPGSNTSVVFLVYVDFLISPKENSFQNSKESVCSKQVVS